MKIAVVIRGHMRTWNFVKHQLFHVMEYRYKNIDWYFTTWEESLSDVAKHNLHQDFHGKNLKLYTTTGCLNYSSWFGPGLLCEQVTDDLMAKHYDMVVETRPDVYLDMPDDRSFPVVIEKNSIHLTGMNLVNSLVPGYELNHHFGAPDWFFIFDQQSFYTYSQRRLRPGPQDSHGDIIRIAKENSINIFTGLSKCLNTVLVRPNIFERPEDATWLWEHGGSWNPLPSDEKKRMLVENNIALEDYITNNKLISL